MESNMRILGTWVAGVDDKLVVQSEVGTVEIRLEDILFLRHLSEEDISSLGFHSPNATRYLFAPSAIPLKEGERYYQNVWVVLNTVTFGVSDNVTITAGIEAISTFITIFTSERVGPGLMGNVKYGKKLGENFYLGGGLLAAATVGEGISEGNAALAYGIATWGNPDNHITIGAGTGLAAGEWIQGPVMVVGGTHRVNRGLALVTENWIIPTFEQRPPFRDVQTGASYPGYTDAIVRMAFSGGVRVLTEKNTFDIALVTAGQWEEYGLTNFRRASWVPIPLPYLDFVYQF